MKTTIRLSGPAEVLAVLPYQLGFHPSDCLVAVSLHGTRMGLVQRLDLPPIEHVGRAVEAMTAPLLRDKPQAVMLVGFEDRQHDSRPMLEGLAQACRAQDVEIAHRIVVRSGRWYDLDCLPSCPSGGLPLPAPGAVPAIAEFVGREISPLADRAALADLLEPRRPAVALAVSGPAQEWSRLRIEASEGGRTEHSTRQERLHGFRASELALWSRVLSGDDDAELIEGLPPQDLAILAVSLTDVHLRDAVIAWLCPGALPPDTLDPLLWGQIGRALPGPARFATATSGRDEAGRAGVICSQRIERRLCELSAALPDVWAVATLTVLASFTWWRGEGALTRVALERALRIDPYYRLAQLLERMVDLGVRP